MLLFIEKGINVSERLIRRPDLDRPPLKMPCNGVLLPQTVAFESSTGGITEMSVDTVNALGIYGQVKALPYMNSSTYVSNLWRRMRESQVCSSE